MTDKIDIDNVRYSFETQEFFQRQIEEAINTLINEETKFKETVEKGIKILDEEISNSKNIFNGEVAFKLYDTYGCLLYTSDAADE